MGTAVYRFGEGSMEIYRGGGLRGLRGWRKGSSMRHAQRVKKRKTLKDVITKRIDGALRNIIVRFNRNGWGFGAGMIYATRPASDREEFLGSTKWEI